VHNLLFIQSVNAFGLYTFMRGPYTGHNNDLGAFRDSGMRKMFESSCRRCNIPVGKYKKLGDKIFTQRPPCFLALKRKPQAGAEAAFEKAESKCRTLVEWPNGKLKENWKMLTFKHRLSVQLSAVGQYVMVGAILTNALTLLNGSVNSSTYADSDQNPFGLEMPELDDYFFQRG
jgi:hypothetical protein